MAFRSHAYPLHFLRLEHQAYQFGRIQQEGFLCYQKVGDCFILVCQEQDCFCDLIPKSFSFRLQVLEVPTHRGLYILDLGLIAKKVASHKSSYQPQAIKTSFQEALASFVEQNSLGHFVGYTSRTYLSLDQTLQACDDVETEPFDRNVSTYAQFFLPWEINYHFMNLSF